MKIIATAFGLCLLAAGAQAAGGGGGAGGAAGGSASGAGTGGTAASSAGNAGNAVNSGTSNAVGTNTGMSETTGGVVNGNPAAVGRSSARSTPPVNAEDNPTGATGVNPYTGARVGQPLQPNDLGSPESKP